jgi:hypothetical protein
MRNTPEVSDDISSHSLLTRLVSVAALLGANHPRLTLYSGYSVTFLLSLLVTNHTCRKSCQLCTIIFRGTKSAPGEPEQNPPKNRLFNFKAGSSRNMAWPWQENMTSPQITRQILLAIWRGPSSLRRIFPRLPYKPLLFVPSSTRHCLSTVLPTPNLLINYNFYFYFKRLLYVTSSRLVRLSRALPKRPLLSLEKDPFRARYGYTILQALK